MKELIELATAQPLGVNWYAVVGMGGMVLFGVASLGLYLLMELS